MGGAAEGVTMDRGGEAEGLATAMGDDSSKPQLYCPLIAIQRLYLVRCNDCGRQVPPEVGRLKVWKLLLSLSVGNQSTNSHLCQWTNMGTSPHGCGRTCGHGQKGCKHGSTSLYQRISGFRLQLANRRRTGTLEFGRHD